MKALSIHQPWIDWILHMGKDIENRNWKPPNKMIGQYIALHSSKTYELKAWRDLCVIFPKLISVEPSDKNKFTYGAILGVAKIKEIITVQEESPWFQGPYGWVLENVVPLSEPIYCKGYMKLWNISDEIEKEIWKQIEENTIYSYDEA